MKRTMLGGKIHRAIVTDANLDYIGSITIDTTLLKAANIIPYELVHIVDVTNGARLQTYAIPAEPNSGRIEINGAAAHHIKIGDIIIIMSFLQVELMDSMNKWKPKIAFVDENNKLSKLLDENGTNEAYYTWNEKVT